MKIPVEWVSEGCKIKGNFYQAVGEPPFPTALLLPGWPGNEEDVLGLGQRMSQYGIHVLTFNYRGTHQSEGTWSLKNALEDTQAAWSYLHEEAVIQKFQIDTGKLVLGGTSFGGGMALSYAASHPEIRRVISIAGTDHGEFAREYLRDAASSEMIDAMFEELKFPHGPVHFEGKKAIKELTQNPDPYDLRLNAPALADRDLLLVGGWDDPFVTIEHHILPLYRVLVNTKARQVRIVALQDGHAFKESREELARIVINWILL